METYSERTIKKHVRAEIENIKKYATKKEIGKLNFTTLDPEVSWDCIYGQMKGDCESPEGRKMIDKCCIKLGTILSSGFKKDKADRARGGCNASFLEMFIYQYPQNNENIIKYLKGEIDTLKLKM